MYSCKFCKKEFEKGKSVASHTKWCKENPNKDIPFKNITPEDRIRINKKTNTNLIRNKTSNDVIEKRKKTFYENHKKGLHNFTGKSMDPNKEIERKRKLSIIAKERKLGGYIKGSGRGKKGWYKGIWCDSSYELAWVIYNLEHGIKFKRNCEKFEYSFENKILKWIPDFILDDNSYVEIKGFLTEKTEAKFRCFKKPLKVLLGKNLKEIFEFVINKFGKDFIKLYKKED